MGQSVRAAAFQKEVMKVFVTGGNGFIGSRVVRRLRSAGYKVRCLLRAAARTDRIADQQFERIEGDVRDRAAVETGIMGCEAAIHLASLSAWNQIESPAVESVVVEGTRNVLEAAGRSIRVVHVSSVAAIGATRSPHVQDESSPYNLDGERGLSYAQAKHRAELLCREAVGRGAGIVIANPAETYGPDDTGLGTAGNLIDFANGPLTMVCRGGACVTHVEDVAGGIVAALERGRAGERYILGGENLTHRKLARLFLEVAELRKPVLTVSNALLRWFSRAAQRLRIPLPFHPNVVAYATRYWFVDSSKAVRELRVRFRNARDTLAPTVAWLKAEGHIR